jgi:hypothetical protein
MKHSKVMRTFVLPITPMSFGAQKNIATKLKLRF